MLHTRDLVSRLGLEILRLSVVDSESDSESKYQGMADLKADLLFEGKKAESDSKFRDSRFRTRNRSRNRNRFFTMQCIGLGIGLGILTYKVSDSESGLENRDSGNSGTYPILDWEYRQGISE